MDGSRAPDGEACLGVAPRFTSLFFLFSRETSEGKSSLNVPLLTFFTSNIQSVPKEQYLSLPAVWLPTYRHPCRNVGTGCSEMASGAFDPNSFQ